MAIVTFVIFSFQKWEKKLKNETIFSRKRLHVNEQWKPSSYTKLAVIDESINKAFNDQSPILT